MDPNKTKRELLEEINLLRQKISQWEGSSFRDEQYCTQAANALLRLFAVSTCRREYLGVAVKLIHLWSACRYVGIRVLNHKGEIPYESYLGFSREFWEAENWLSIQGDRCLCIRVITGQPDSPEIGMMSRGGSFFTDNSLNFLRGLTKEQRQQYRGTCMKCGFKSLGIIPLVSRGKIVGVIHLADDEGGKIDAPLIDFLEQAGFYIGQALQKFNADEDNVADKHIRLLMERSRHSVSLLTLDSQYVCMNTTGYLLQRLDGPDALRGLSVTDHVFEGREALQAAMERAASGEEAGAQYRSIDQVGRVIRWESRFIPLKKTDGAIHLILSISRETSDS